MTIIRTRRFSWLPDRIIMRNGVSLFHWLCFAVISTHELDMLTDWNKWSEALKDGYANN